MKAHFHVRETIVFLLLLIATQSKAQHPAEKHNYQRWAYLAGVQGNNFGLPFHDLPSHFTHPGIFVGAERAYKPRSTVFPKIFIGRLSKQTFRRWFVYQHADRITPPIYQKLLRRIEGWNRLSAYFSPHSGLYV